MNVTSKRSYLPTGLAFAIGAVVWFGHRVILGVDDPQSHPSYLALGYPLLVVTSAVLGAFFSHSPWRWGVYLILTQFILGITIVSGDLNLWPIGLVIHVVMVIPCILASYLGAWCKTWIKDRNKEKMSPT